MKSKTGERIGDLYAQMNALIYELKIDLPKAESGNKAASQRVRVNSVKFEKTAKIYRRVSVQLIKATAKKKTKKKSAKKSPAWD